MFRLDAFRIRLALMGAGLITLCVYLAMGGRLGAGDRGSIQIEYGAYPEEFEGLQVAIDDRPAGTLRPFGAATRTGFEVKEGDHRVRVMSARFASEPRDVTVEAGRTILLVLDVTESMGAQTSRPRLSLR